jgi:pyridinium-3,5-bisthiocarboxylic acid mononucleotide nickel chelatase
VPAPAVLRIAATADLDLASGDLTGERTTPTGAALLATAATPGGFPAMKVRAVGTGGGGRDTPDRPNITRVVIGASGAERDLREGDVTVVESTVDDLDPRLWPSVLQAVRAAGAWDCWYTPIVGRHGRPGQVLTALCAEPVHRAVAAAIFAHTGTLGVRLSRMNRLTASRTSVEVEVGPPGSSQVVTVKVADATDGPRASERPRQSWPRRKPPPGPWTGPCGPSARPPSRSTAPGQQSHGCTAAKGNS